MGKLRTLTIGMLFGILLLGAPAYPGGRGLGTLVYGPGPANGQFEVLVMSKTGWVSAGALSYDKFISTQALDLSGYIAGPGKVRIKLEQHGGGKAHLDAVLLGGQAPAEMVSGSSAELKKVSAPDNDLLNYREGMEFSFDATGGRALTVSARIEPVVISKDPVALPESNGLQPVGPNSRFYNYTLGTNPGSLEVDANLQESSAVQPFLKALTRNGSGHPIGYTYVWVKNDAENLYVAMDFTSDNTYDGDDDYGIVHVKAGNTVKDFKVTLSQTRWGRTGFGYTDKVAYQHKTYEFQIPLAEIGARSGAIGLAFSVYGTATIMVPSLPNLSYNRGENQYLLCFNYNGRQVLCPLVNANGKFLSKGVFLSPPSVNYLFNPPQLARDNGGHRWLVVWLAPDDWDIMGAFINDDGKIMGGVPDASPPARASDFSIRIAASAGVPAVAFDPQNKVYLIVWSGDGKIMGRFLGREGEKLGAAFPIFVSENGFAVYPAVAYDSLLNRFLVVFGKGTEIKSALVEGPLAIPIGSAQIFGQLVSYPTGAVTRWMAAGKDLISISSGNMWLGEIPTVTFCKSQSRFLVSWMNPHSQVLGQMIHSFGLPLGGANLIGLANFVISDTNHEKTALASAVDDGAGEFLLLWQDLSGIVPPPPGEESAPAPSSPSNIFGQLVAADGSLIAGNFRAFGPKDSNESLENPSVAFNSLEQHFRGAFDYTPDIFNPNRYIETEVVDTP